jgi:predicted secreted protein
VTTGVASAAFVRRWTGVACATLIAVGAASLARAQTIIDVAPTSQPIVTITASATSNVPNDRMHAFMRAEAENVDAAQAASDVNARMARALSRARAATGVEASTAGYGSFQVTEQNQPTRWRVSQTLVLESGDFAMLSALVSKLQATDGVLLSELKVSSILGTPGYIFWQESISDI